jgi:hypothetical protein
MDEVVCFLNMIESYLFMLNNFVSCCLYLPLWSLSFVCLFVFLYTLYACCHVWFLFAENESWNIGWNIGLFILQINSRKKNKEIFFFSKDLYIKTIINRGAPFWIYYSYQLNWLLWLEMLMYMQVNKEIEVMEDRIYHKNQQIWYFYDNFQNKHLRNKGIQSDGKSKSNSYLDILDLNMISLNLNIPPGILVWIFHRNEFDEVLLFEQIILLMLEHHKLNLEQNVQ